MRNFKWYYKPLITGLALHSMQPKTRLALVVGMLPWRDYVADWIFESNYVQIQRHFDKYYFNMLLKPFLKATNPVIYIWGYKAPQFFIDYIREQNLDIFFLEDGFIRSEPDADKNSPPLSIVIDSQAPYFDTTRPNDLTDLINNFDFEQDGYDEELAQELLDYFVSHRVSKYNHQPYVDVSPIYGIKNSKRILVLGQVPHDDSLKYGGGSGITLLNLAQKAIEDNPNSQIIVKPHPMTLDDKQTIQALEDLKCLILDQPLHLVDALETIDHVYTITSLGGFEALLRGKKVTVLGRPFYGSLCHTDQTTTYKDSNRNKLMLLAYLIYSFSS